ncbi:MAG: autotransporter-associated beta strand repeat-containing protein [Verrucomicrobia bacterium]|nr:autotransporter-associated beta strand repeat-containing protein [Verrucomicrobiota bacterium]
MSKYPFSQGWIGVASMALSLGLPTAGAASLYWDGTSSGADADGGIGTWSTAPATTNWDTSASGGNNVAWTNGSDAVFGGTGGLVTVSGTVSANSLSFRTASYSLTGGNVTLTGTSVIDLAGNDVTLGSLLAGSAPISKTGAGTLTLSGANSYSGVLTIAEGTVKAGSATAFGSTATATTVAPGATLELNGQNLGTEPIIFSGTGVGGAGAIVNNGAAILNALQYATLAGPATVGGTQRWDIRGYGYLNMAGFTLTKTGPGDFHLVTTPVTSPGNIDVKEGSFWIELASTLAGTAANVITIRQGAMLGQWSNNSNAQPWTARFETNTTWRPFNGPSRWDGPVTLAGTTTLDVVGSASMSHFGVISGPGSVVKTGTGTWTPSSFHTFTGGTSVNAGKVVLNAANAGIGTLRGAVTVNSGGLLELAVAEALGSSTGTRISPLTINGGLVDDTSNGGNSGEVVNLAAGTLRSNAGINSPAAKSYFTLAGGSVVNSLPADTPSVISGRLDLGYLGSGNTGTPTTFNVDAGNETDDLRIDAAITEATAGHGLTKSGHGLMALNGSCLFTGGTTVQAGTLVLAAGGSLPDSPVTVKTGGRFGTSTTGKSLTSLAAEPGSSLLLPVQTNNTTMVTGELALASGTIGISPLLGTGTVAGTYDLITADAITGAGTPVLDLAGAFGSTRASGSVAVNGNKLQLILAGTGANLVWNNASASGSAAGTWNTTLANFSHGGGNDVFQAFDSVTFNDSVAPGTAKTITLGPTLAPVLLVVDNSNGAYTFTSNGGLAGAGSLVKTGSASLTIGGTDGYAMTGDITAGGGIIDFAGQPLSIGKLTITGGGAFNNAAATVSSANLQSGSADATLIGATTWTKSTGGTVVLTANNQLSGAGAVAAGNLILGNATTPNAMGSLGTGPVTIAGGASVTFSRSDAAVIANAFGSAGALNLLGSNNGSNGASNFSLTADSSDFSGPLTVTNARLSLLTGKEIGRGVVTLNGRVSLYATGLIVPNTFHVAASGGWGSSTSSDNLNLTNARLTGTITLAGSTSTSVSVLAFGSSAGMYGSSNTISGPISEAGGPASLSISSGTPPSTLTLSGASSYRGTTTISGQAVVNLTGSLGATAVTVWGLSTIGGTGSIGTGGSLTFSNLAILKLTMSGGALTVNGNVNLGPNTTVAVDVTQTPVMDGPIPVLNYTGTLTGTAAQLTMDTPSYYRKAVFGFTPGHITLNIGTKAILWKGASGYIWDYGGIKLWNTTGAGETESFYRGDRVTFDDTGSGYVISTYTMEPSSVLVNNSSKDYLISATIGGPCALTKNGSGGLKLSANNSYAGGTIINAGRLEAQLSGLGTGPVSVAAGATLAGDATITGPVTIAGTLDPGLASQTWPAVLATGPTVLTGNYLCQLDTDRSDTLAVTGDLHAMEPGAFSETSCRPHWTRRSGDAHMGWRRSVQRDQPGRDGARCACHFPGAG